MFAAATTSPTAARNGKEAQECSDSYIFVRVAPDTYLAGYPANIFAGYWYPAGYLAK